MVGQFRRIPHVRACDQRTLLGQDTVAHLVPRARTTKACEQCLMYYDLDKVARGDMSAIDFPALVAVLTPSCGLEVNWL